MFGTMGPLGGLRLAFGLFKLSRGITTGSKTLPVYEALPQIANQAVTYN
jgi:hypothetical protein